MCLFRAQAEASAKAVAAALEDAFDGETEAVTGALGNGAVTGSAHACSR